MNDLIHTGTKAATYGGSGMAIVFGLTLNEWGVIAGTLIALCGLVVQIVSTYNRNRRAEELHAAQLEAVRVGKNALSLRGGEDSSSDSEG